MPPDKGALVRACMRTNRRCEIARVAQAAADITAAVAVEYHITGIVILDGLELLTGDPSGAEFPSLNLAYGSRKAVCPF